MQWTSQPRQYAFLTSDEDVVLYGGARGGGKTDALLADHIATCMEYDGAQTTILRKDFAELSKPKAAIPRSFDFLQPLADRGLVKWRESDHQWTFSNGSVLQFGHLQDRLAINKYLGAQIDKLSIDQCEEVRYEEFNKLRGSVRSTGARHASTGQLLHPHMRLTANPGGVGQSWVKALFIDSAPSDTRFWVDTRGDDPVISSTPLSHAQTYRFVPAKVWDNQALLDVDPGYIDRLYATGGQIARAWVEGDWSGFAGQFYPEWTISRHVVAPFRIPYDWPKWHSTDYGIAKPSCTLWMARATTRAKAPDGKIVSAGDIVVYRERYEVRRTVEQQALKIRLWSGDEHYRNQILDTACWGLESNGRTIAEMFAANGVAMAQANKNRIAGWARIRELLRWCSDPEFRPCPDCAPTAQILNQGCTHNTFHPGLLVQSVCPNLIRTLPNLVRLESNWEDCDSNGEDHAPDALRYGVMAQDVQPDELDRIHTPVRLGARY